MKIFDKDELYKRTAWFSKDCGEMINTLAEFGLVIVDKGEAERANDLLKNMEDDLR